MSVTATAACSLLIGLSTLHASSNPRLGEQLALFYSLLLVGTLSLVALISTLFAAMTSPHNSSLFHLLAGLTLSTLLTVAVLTLCRNRLLFLRRLRGHTVSAVGNTSAAALLLPQFLSNAGLPLSLFIILAVCLGFYCVIVSLTALRETMRLRAAAASLSLSHSDDAVQDPLLAHSTPLNPPLITPQNTDQNTPQELAHALLALCVITLCLFALLGAL